MGSEHRSTPAANSLLASTSLARAATAPITARHSPGTCSTSSRDADCGLAGPLGLARKPTVCFLHFPGRNFSFRQGKNSKQHISGGSKSGLNFTPGSFSIVSASSLSGALVTTVILTPEALSAHAKRSCSYVVWLGVDYGILSRRQEYCCIQRSHSVCVAFLEISDSVSGLTITPCGAVWWWNHSSSWNTAMAAAVWQE